MTVPSDITVILPGEDASSTPRRALRSVEADVVVVGVTTAAPDEAVIEELVAALTDADANAAAAAFSARPKGLGWVLGPGAAPFAVRREALADLDVTEDWAEVGYELAAQLTAHGRTVVELADEPATDPATRSRALPLVRVRVRWSRPVVWRRERLARRRSPKEWSAADTELASTLDNLDDATNYAEWIVALMAPHLSGRILEVGAGHGTFTDLLARFGPVTATELSDRAVALLEARYVGSARVTVVHVEDLHDSAFDTAVLVNVLEHIDDDVGALRSVGDDLRPGGEVVVFSPAFNALYSRFDSAVGHYRRYTRATLVRAVADADLELVEARYVNAPGALAWYVLATRLGQRPTAGWSTMIYDRVVVPVVRRVEQWWRPPFGQSLLVVARRPVDSGN